MLTEVRDSLQKALDEGKPFEEWKKEIVPKLEGKWLGKSVGQLWDELSDEEKAKRTPPSEKEREKVIGSERLELIFRTNMAVANAAGHYEQLMKTKAIYPYWRYVTRDDARVRDAHRALHNKVFKWDDPFWETYFPPNGFRCRCHVSPLTKRQVERDPKLHLEQSNIAEDADGRKVLDVGGSYYKNNPGWDYNPGDGVNHLVSLAKSNEKGRPAQVQADLEADLAKKEAEEAAAAKAKAEAEEQRKAEENRRAAEAEKQRQAAEAEKTRAEAERKAQEIEHRLQEAQSKAEQRKAEREAKEAAAKAEAERLEAEKKAKEEERRKAEEAEKAEKTQQEAERKAQEEAAKEAAAKADIDAKEADKKVKDLRLDQPDKLKQSCLLEHTIAKREHALIEEELAKAEKSGADKAKIDALRTRAQTILSNSKANLDCVGTEKEGDDLAISARHTTQREQNSLLKGLHKEAFDLRISQLPAEQQKQEREKRKAALKNRRNIKIANRNILFADKKNPTDEELYNSRLMQREFDLMLYNFSPQKLAFYSDYCQRYVKNNDYLFDKGTESENKSSEYNPTDRRCRIKFQTISSNSSLRILTDYQPTFEWRCRFHEEMHQIDALVGNSKQGELTDLSNKGEILQNAIVQDIMTFVNKTRMHLHKHLEHLSQNDPALLENYQFKNIFSNSLPTTNPLTQTNNGSLASVYYYIASQYNDHNQLSLESITDLMGICSRDALGEDAVSVLGYLHYHYATEIETRDIKPLYQSHDRKYNTDSLERALENKEAWASINSAELSGNTAVVATNLEYLPHTVRVIHSILD